MAGVSVGFAKCFMLFMAIVILVQGLAYLGLSLWGITMQDCQETTNIAADPFKFAMNLIYFVQEECGPPIIELSYDGVQGSYPLTMDWHQSYETKNREFIFMVTYAVVSGLWVAASALIILTLCCATTKLISGVIYWPWFLSVLAGCILDIVATVYHGMDISKTLTLNDAFEFVGATLDPTTPSEVVNYLDTFGVYFSTPAILMTCLSCRVVIIWLLNVIGGIFCLSLSNVLANQTAAKTNSQPIERPLPAQQSTAYVAQMQQPTAPTSVTPQLEEEPQFPEQVRPKPSPLIIPAQTSDMLERQDSRYQANDRTTLQSPVQVLPPPQQQPQSPLSPQQENSTYRNTDAHPDQLNYPASDSTTPRPATPLSPAAQQLASSSALNSRYSEIYPMQPTNPRISEELRNQMPWSYTNMITKPPPPPRKPQQQVQIYPQIPEPDYAEY
ncbi:uncharacterized protein LOC6581528 [Drosophila mojavensis]|uniref:Uncharacterized protein n=1 Tax=Drosophila mojavensis TaxID=7230 RepID=B4KYF3_DROMO|nr:uncharacterized protein LOC6581528 [Drosophila mojavensis]EDW17732.1 uncharacterized protein Dmoj_GI12480 [Drosophila mojavensis]